MAKRSFQMDDVICSIIEEGADGCVRHDAHDAGALRRMLLLHLLRQGSASAPSSQPRR